MVHSSLKHSCLTNTDHESKKGGAHFYPSNNGQQEYKSPESTGIPCAGSIRHFLTLLLNSHSTLTLRAKTTATLIRGTQRASWGGLRPKSLHSQVARCKLWSVSLTHKSIVSLITLPKPRKKGLEISPSGHWGRNDTCLCYLFHISECDVQPKMFLKASTQNSTIYSYISCFFMNKKSTSCLL